MWAPHGGTGVAGPAGLGSPAPLWEKRHNRPMPRLKGSATPAVSLHHPLQREPSSEAAARIGATAHACQMAFPPSPGAHACALLVAAYSVIPRPRRGTVYSGQGGFSLPPWVPRDTPISYVLSICGGALLCSLRRPLLLWSFLCPPPGLPQRGSFFPQASHFL